jgi:phosphatidylserine synthase
MFDSRLRPVKDRLLGPIARSRVGVIHPNVVCGIGLVLGLGAALAAWRGALIASVALWLLSRIADGLDGLVARRQGRASDLGGLLDFVVDTIVYASIPIGLAFAADDRATWIATTVLLASFYLNSVSLGASGALLERQTPDALTSATHVPLPRGLIEGTETIVLFTIALAVPSAVVVIWALMATAVTATALERVRWTWRTLR